MDLNKYLEKNILVKFYGGREVCGILKGFDPLVNLVLDNGKEYLRDESHHMTNATRPLGLVICRGTAVVMLCPQDGMEPIQNPFGVQDDDE